MSESVKVESQDWTPTIERVSFGSDVAQVAEIVDRDGGVILTDVLTREEVDAVNRELEPSMERHAGSALAEVFAGVTATGRKEKEKTGYEGARTRHLQHCVKRSKTYRDKILASEILGEYVEAVVPGCFGRFSCFASVVIDALPGEIRQNLHRDGFFLFGPYTGHGNDNRLPNVFCNTLLALTDSTEEMGATRVIPRSGHWSDLSGGGSQDQTIPVEMQAGEMFFYNGKTLHSGGANTTDRTRRLLATSFTRPDVMGEEAWPFVISLDEARTYPKRVQELLGFRSITTTGEKPGFLWRVDTKPLEEHLDLEP